MTDHISRDWEFLWIWCGTEEIATIIGPFDSEELIAHHLARYSSFDENGVRTSGCEHDHVSFRGTIAQLAPKFLGGTVLANRYDAPAIATPDGQNYLFKASGMAGINDEAARGLCDAVLDLREKVAA